MNNGEDRDFKICGKYDLVKTDDGEDTATLISDPVLEPGVWAHVAATVNAEGYQALYVNGRLMGERKTGVTGWRRQGKSGSAVWRPTRSWRTLHPTRNTDTRS